MTNPKTRILPSGTSLLRLVGLTVAAVVLLGCADDTGNPPAKNLRIAALNIDTDADSNRLSKDIQVDLPTARPNPQWSQAGGNSTHTMSHLAFGRSPRLRWITDIGKGRTLSSYLLTLPVSDGKQVYSLDSKGMVSSMGLLNGEIKWQVEPDPPGGETRFTSGGLAVSDGKLLVATGNNDLVALETSNGRVLWRQSMSAPIHTAPMVVDQKVFAVSVENEVVVYAMADGRKLWSQHGVPNSAGLLGVATPAASNGVAVVGFSSGELYGILTELGRVIWSDSSVPQRRVEAAAALPDIIGSPVLDQNLAIAVRHSGGTFAVDIRNGERIWNRQIAGDNQPWVVGKFIYIVSTTGQLYCLQRDTGKTVWQVNLPRVNSRDPSKSISWAGPILAGDRLILTSSHGKLMMLSPFDGSFVASYNLPQGSRVAPIVVDGTLLVQTEGGYLIAWK
ncbi:MAG: PQQ-binding-like beta-propeller repeat protein [Candidatus Pacebacteria bacterium]|nr:PQQ-binding-like beta-propeller repeat protein [Candidatus Paceibacterota bacterium]